MDIAESHAYAAPIDAVLTMLGDRDATVAKYESMHHRDVEVRQCTRDGDRLRVVSSRVVDVDLPSFAKRVLKPTNTMRQTDEWRRREDGTWAGTFDVEVQGAPIHLSGTMSLTPEADKTIHDVAVRVEVRVPLIGGRIAEWAAKGDVQRSVDGEFAFNDDWLHEHSSTTRRSTKAKAAPKR